MQFSVVFLAILALGAAIPQTPKQQAADKDLLRKQQHVISLLENIKGHIPDEQLHNLGVSYDIEANLHNYVDPSVVKYVVGSVTTDNVQPKHTPFAVSISRLRREIALLHRVLIGAKDYDTFLKTAAWVRVHFNEHQFVKAFVTAVLERADTQGVILPPPYEVFPHYFLDSRIIQAVQDVKSHGIDNPVAGNVVHIPVNYTAQVEEGENKLNYWTQDIGLAAYYTYVTYAGYMHSENFDAVHGTTDQTVDTSNIHKIGRGARFYYLHQQLLARYNLERLSNGLGPIETLDLHDAHDIHVPFNVHQRFSNGLEFPPRPETVNLADHHPRLLETVRKFERRIIDAIDSGNVLTPQGMLVSILNPQGLNILGNLIESTGRSINPRFYGSLVGAAKQLLGVAPHITSIWDFTPSALELPETSVKDPAFYQLFKRIIHLFEQYQEGLPHHVYNDVVLPGVNIEKIVVSPLVTFFSDYDVNVDNAVVEPVEGEQSVHVHATLKRLDHHPYEFQIVVKSDKAVPNAVVRVFLGPKYNHYGQHVDINKDRLSFIELDQFYYNLVEGRNVIVRNSQQSSVQSWDWPSIQAIKDSVDAAVRSQNPFYITEPQQIFGFPARLSLPKGTQSGLPLQLFVVISAQEQVVPESYYGIVPEREQNFNEHSFNVVDEEHYNQHFTQNNVVPVSSNTPVIAVVPQYENNLVPAAVKHYGYLYKHWPGHQTFPRWQQHHYYHGEGEGFHHLGLMHGGHGVGGYPRYLQHGLSGFDSQTVVGQHVAGHVNVEGQVPVHTVGHIGLSDYYGEVGQAGVPVPNTVGGIYGQGIAGLGHGSNGVGVGVGIGAGSIGAGVGVGGIHGGISGGVHGGVHNGVHGGVHGNVQGGVHGGVHGAVHSRVHAGIHESTFAETRGQIQNVHLHLHGNGHYPAQHETVPGYSTHDEQLYNYYESQPIGHLIGGAISLDGKSLGWPLDRPLDISALYAPNIHITDVVVHHVDYPVNPVTGQEIYSN